MGSFRENFDPTDITRDDMNQLAEIFEEYINMLEKVMIIPDDIYDECKKNIDEAIKRVRKLIKKLRKGDKSVFKDEDEWNNLV